MKKITIILFILTMILSVPARATDSTDTKTRYVNTTDGLNLRKTCSVKDTILAVIPYGAQVTQTETIGLGAVVWAHVTYGTATGYVRAEYLSDENPLDGKQYLGKWRITAYAYTGYACANGQYPETGYTIACNSLPFGTRVYIDGIGERVVEDRGPQSMGNYWIDLYLGDTEECVQWGSQERDVWVIEE